MEFLPKEISDGLNAARRDRARKRGRLKVRVGGEEFAILRYWDTGFSIDPADAPHVRGLVDVFDGARHLSHALIVASGEDEGEMVYEVKCETRAVEAPAPDYVRDAGAPAGLIESV